MEYKIGKTSVSANATRQRKFAATSDAVRTATSRVCLCGSLSMSDTYDMNFSVTSNSWTDSENEKSGSVFHGVSCVFFGLFWGFFRFFLPRFFGPCFGLLFCVRLFLFFSFFFFCFFLCCFFFFLLFVFFFCFLFFAAFFFVLFFVLLCFALLCFF